VKNVLDGDIPFDERTMIDDDDHEKPTGDKATATAAAP
jgi:hypothetical protein